MPELQNKNTSAFMEAINKYAEEQRAKMQNEVETFKKQELEKAETEVLNDSYKLIQKEMSDMRKEIISKLSQKDMLAKRELLSAREKIMDDVFNKVTKKLAEYTDSQEYTNLLKKQSVNISSVLPKTGTVLYVREQDLKYKETITESFGSNCKVLADNQIKIGGIKGKNQKKGLVADETLDSKLKQQKEWFEVNSGLKVV